MAPAAYNADFFDVENPVETVQNLCHCLFLTRVLPYTFGDIYSRSFFVSAHLVQRIFVLRTFQQLSVSDMTTPSREAAHSLL